MCLFTWANRQIKTLKWYHVSLIKLSSAAFALFIAKLWPPLLSLSWEAYLVISLVAALPVLARMLCKGSPDAC